MHKSQKAWNIQFLCFGIKATDAFFRYLYPAFTSFVLIFSGFDTFLCFSFWWNICSASFHFGDLVSFLRR